MSLGKVPEAKVFARRHIKYLEYHGIITNNAKRAKNNILFELV